MTVTKHAQAERARVRIGLLEAGYDIIASLPPDMYLPERIAQLQPDMIIVDAESDARDARAHRHRHARRAPPDRHVHRGPGSGEHGSRGGGRRLGLHRGRPAGQRIKPVLQVALAQFKREQKLLDELSDTKSKLAERKVIERAKGLLMERQRFTESRPTRSCALWP
jgi:response regulator NasT